jgi:DNA-binding response OmpR family regulator
LGNLLIVEDDRSLVQMLAWELKARGYAVTCAADCQQARAALGNARFDVALLDVQLPDGDGIALVGELRAHYPPVRVFITSGASCPDLARRALRAGAKRFLSKPVSAERLHRLFRGNGPPPQA